MGIIRNLLFDILRVEGSIYILLFSLLSLIGSIVVLILERVRAKRLTAERKTQANQEGQKIIIERTDKLIIFRKVLAIATLASGLFGTFMVAAAIGLSFILARENVVLFALLAAVFLFQIIPFIIMRYAFGLELNQLLKLKQDFGDGLSA